MSTEHEDTLRDLAAMFALAGLVMRGHEDDGLTDKAYDLAEEFMDTRANRPERGIAGIKRARRKKEM